MNPFFFVRYQSQKASPPLTSDDDVSRNALARKALVRQDLENRNQGLYSWNQDLELKGLCATSVEMGLGKLGRFIKTEWPLVLAALLLLTGLSLVSFQIFIVLVCLIVITLMLIIGQEADQYRGLMTEAYTRNLPVTKDFVENQPRFIPLTQRKSTQGRVEKPRRQPPRQYRLNPSSTDSRPQVS
jgi:hypothetical protein